MDSEPEGASLLPRRAISLPVGVQDDPLLVREGALFGVTRETLDVSRVVKLRLHLPAGS